MGQELDCRMTYQRRTLEGRAYLESDHILFRGLSGSGERLKVALKDLQSVSSEGGVLHLDFGGERASLELGAAAEKWADKILHPPSRLDKIGAKAEWRASAIGVDDKTFLGELEGRVAHLSIGRVVKGSDAIFFGVTTEIELDRLGTLKRSLKPNGALWIIRPKGRPEISERATMAAGKRAGLVDVKVVGFSATHTAEKFVIPVAAR